MNMGTVGYFQSAQQYTILLLKILIRKVYAVQIKNSPSLNKYKDCIGGWVCVVLDPTEA